ncbi:MAG: putative oxidoreductase, partial [bacterium]
QITPIEEVMRAFDDLVRQGKVLYIGISDAPAWVVSRANTLAELRGWTSFAGLQIEYSLVERTPERELLPMAQALGLTVTAWSPLAGGVLSGKYLDSDTKNARYTNPQMQQFLTNKERSEFIAKEVKVIANECGRSSSQVALAWLRQRNIPIIPIIGARTKSQLKDNLSCLDLSLTKEQLLKLDEVSKIELGFPNELYTKEMVTTFVYGGLKEQIDI